MGCGASKRDTKIDSRILYVMRKTNIPTYDEFFDTVSQYLKLCEDIREGLQDIRKQLMESTNCHWLKKPHLTEALRVFIWSLAASRGGEFLKTEMEVVPEAPYIRFKRHGLRPEQIEIAELWEKYIQVIAKAPQILPNAQKKLQLLNKEGQELIDKTEEEARSVGITGTEAWRTVRSVTWNLQVLSKGIANVKILVSLDKSRRKELIELITDSKEFDAEIGVIGKKAAEENCVLPKEIFDQFHTGSKMSKEEFETEYGNLPDSYPKKGGSGQSDKPLRNRKMSLQIQLIVPTQSSPKLDSYTSLKSLGMARSMSHKSSR